MHHHNWVLSHDQCSHNWLGNYSRMPQMQPSCIFWGWTRVYHLYIWSRCLHESISSSMEWTWKIPKPYHPHWYIPLLWSILERHRQKILSRKWMGRSGFGSKSDHHWLCGWGHWWEELGQSNKYPQIHAGSSRETSLWQVSGNSWTTLSRRNCFTGKAHSEWIYSYWCSIIRWCRPISPHGRISCIQRSSEKWGAGRNWTVLDAIHWLRLARPVNE